MSELAERLDQGRDPSRQTAAQLVEKMKGEFAKVLPEHLTADQFARLALTELRTNPQLAQCSAPSLLGALMTAARLGLEPGGPLGQFYLTPRKIKGTWAVVPIVGYQGMRDLAYRSGVVKDITAVLIREGDEYEEGANEQRGLWFEWKPGASPFERGAERPVIGVLALASLTTGGRVHVRLSMNEVDARRARGSAGDRGPWGTDFEAMVRKSGIRALAALLPKTAAFAIATQADEVVQDHRPETVIAEDVDMTPVPEEGAPDGGTDS